MESLISGSKKHCNKKIKYFFTRFRVTIIVCGMQEGIHHTVFLAAMEKAHSIPHADLTIILSKPDVALRRQDQLWRRTCAKYGISTEPLGVATDGFYHRAYYLAGKLKEAHNQIKKLEKKAIDSKDRSRILDLENELSAVKLALARARIDLERMG